MVTMVGTSEYFLPVTAEPGLTKRYKARLGSLPQQAVLGSYPPKKGANHEDQDVPVIEPCRSCRFRICGEHARAGARRILLRTRPLRQAAFRLSGPARRDRAASGVRPAPRLRISPGSGVLRPRSRLLRRSGTRVLRAALGNDRRRDRRCSDRQRRRRRSPRRNRRRIGDRRNGRQRTVSLDSGGPSRLTESPPSGGLSLCGPYNGAMPSEPPYSGLTPDAVLDALASAGFAGDGRLLALNSYENRVYQVWLEGEETANSPASVVAKFYRPARWTDAQILEEHAFTLELAGREIPVVAPLADNGKTLHAFGGFRFAVYPRRAWRTRASPPATSARAGCARCACTGTATQETCSGPTTGRTSWTSTIAAPARRSRTCGCCYRATGRR